MWVLLLPPSSFQSENKVNSWVCKLEWSLTIETETERRPETKGINTNTNWDKDLITHRETLEKELKEKESMKLSNNKIITT